MAGICIYCGFSGTNDDMMDHAGDDCRQITKEGVDMKEHIQAEFVNKLKDVANTYAGCECMREVISGVVSEYIDPIRKDIAEKDALIDEQSKKLSKSFRLGKPKKLEFVDCDSEFTDILNDNFFDLVD